MKKTKPMPSYSHPKNKLYFVKTKFLPGPGWSSRPKPLAKVTPPHLPGSGPDPRRVRFNHSKPGNLIRVRIRQPPTKLNFRFARRTSNVRSRLELRSDRRKTSGKRVSDDVQLSIFRRRKNFFGVNKSKVANRPKCVFRSFAAIPAKFEGRTDV